MKIIIIIIIGIFILGYSIGSNSIPFDDTVKSYYSKLTAPNYHEQTSDEILPILYQTNVQSLIHIDNKIDITKTRNQIIDYVWKENVFSKNKMPSKIEHDIQDERYENLMNLEKIDKITITMEHGVESYAYIFLAEQKNEDIILYHQGHAGDFVKGKKTIQFFLEKGYSVVAFSMPLLGMNNQPTIDVENIGVIKLTTHEQFKILDSENFSSLKFFLEPIMIAVNYIENNYNPNSKEGETNRNQYRTPGADAESAGQGGSLYGEEARLGSKGPAGESDHWQESQVTSGAPSSPPNNEIDDPEVMNLKKMRQNIIDNNSYLDEYHSGRRSEEEEQIPTLQETQ